MRIRLMEIADYPAIYRMWSATPGMGLRQRDDSQDGIARFLKRNPATCHVACEGQTILGAMLCGHDGRRGYIYHAVVHENYRGKGIGRKLLEAVIQSLEGEGIHKAALVVFSDNRTGNGFWERMGFYKREDLFYRDKSLTVI